MVERTEEQQKAVRRHQTMADLGRVVSSSLNIDEVYRRLAKKCRKSSM